VAEESKVTIVTSSVLPEGLGVPGTVHATSATISPLPSALTFTSGSLKAIGRILARAFGLENGQGTAFYAFDAVPKPKPYKDEYRARLDSLPLTPADQQRVVDEVKVVFGLNGALFAELSTHLPRFAR